MSAQSPLFVIDGQQRLTTVSLLIEVLARRLGDAEPVEGFSARKLRNYYLLNPEEEGEREFKLILSETDRESLLAVTGNRPWPADASDRIRQNFEFFDSKVAALDGDLVGLCRGLAKLVVVDISLSRADVAEGEIGTLEQLVIISRDPAPPPATYVAASGGLFRDMTIHDFDMARFFLGEVVEVMATGANLISDEIAAAGDIDAAVVVLRGALGTLCSITNSRRCAFGYDQRLEAFGELGMLAAANQLPTSVRFSGATRTEVAPPYHNFFLDRYTPAYSAEMDHFVTAIETGSVPSPGFSDGRAALVLADAANESLRTGTTVKVSET